MIKKGTILWYIDKIDKRKMGWIKVLAVDSKYFYFQYDGRNLKRKLDKIGTVFFERRPVRNHETGVYSPYDSKQRDSRKVSRNTDYSKNTKKNDNYDSEYMSSYVAVKEKPLEPSCSNCYLQVNGTCTSLSNRLCSDFKPKVVISKEETDNWPKYGDASGFRFGWSKKYKK